MYEDEQKLVWRPFRLRPWQALRLSPLEWQLRQPSGGPTGCKMWPESYSQPQDLSTRLSKLGISVDNTLSSQPILIGILKFLDIAGVQLSGSSAQYNNWQFHFNTHVGILNSKRILFILFKNYCHFVTSVAPVHAAILSLFPEEPFMSS